MKIEVNFLMLAWLDTLTAGSGRRLAFGLCCLALALILLLILGVRRLTGWLRRRRRPDLRQQGGGRPYTGSQRPHAAGRPAAVQSGWKGRRFRPFRRRYGSSGGGQALSGYTGSRRLRREKKPLAYSGIGSYKRGGHRSGRYGGGGRASFWNKSYRGKK